jgi:hypothetical protein
VRACQKVLEFFYVIFKLKKYLLIEFVLTFCISTLTKLTSINWQMANKLFFLKCQFDFFQTLFSSVSCSESVRFGAWSRHQDFSRTKLAPVLTCSVGWVLPSIQSVLKKSNLKPIYCHGCKQLGGQCSKTSFNYRQTFARLKGVLFLKFIFKIHIICMCL